jgi:hypothetical protein
LSGRKPENNGAASQCLALQPIITNERNKCVKGGEHDQ